MALDNHIAEIAERIRCLREILEITTAEMAEATGTTEENYISLEKGEQDFTFTFLYKCALRFDVDIIELMTGDRPRLSYYTVTRKGQGLPIERREGFNYRHLAPTFRNKLAEPCMVTAPYKPENESCPIALSHHEGQEINMVIRGMLRVQIEDHEEILREGDTIYYDSAYGHGMAAVGGEDCVFLAVILKKENFTDR